MSVDNPQEARMSLGDHLGELRSRLLWGLSGPLVIAVVSLAFADRILAWLMRPAAVALQSVGLSPQLINTEVDAPFSLYMKVCLITGLVLGIPWLIYHLWMFVAPGLYKHERKLVERMLPASALLSVLGVAFMYYILLPMMLYFLMSFTLTLPMPSLERTWIEDLILPKLETTDIKPDTQPLPRVPLFSSDPESHKPGDMWVKVPENELRIDVGKEVLHTRLTRPSLVMPMPDARRLFDFTIMLALAFAVSFQLPLVMLTVGWVGIVNHKQLASVRKYALLACVVLAAMITPGSDPISLSALTLPLFGLYELGVLLVRWFGKGRSGSDGESPSDATPSAGI